MRERMRPMSEAPPSENCVYAWLADRNAEGADRLLWLKREGGGAWEDEFGCELSAEEVRDYSGWTPIARPLEPDEPEPADDFLRPIEEAPKDKPVLGWYASPDCDPAVIRWDGNFWRNEVGRVAAVSYYSALPIRQVPRATVTAQIPEHKRAEFAEFVKGLGGEVK